MFVTIRGRRMYFWRAVDAEGEVLDFMIQSNRNKAAAYLVKSTAPNLARPTHYGLFYTPTGTNMRVFDAKRHLG